MTGGTLLIKCGNKWYFTSVAHDGYDLQDFDENHFSFNDTPEEIIKKYFAMRAGHGDFEDFGMDIHNNQEDFNKCYYVKETNLIDINAVMDNIFDVMDNIFEEIMNNPLSEDENHPYYQLSCSYMDHILVIDLNRQMKFLNEETENF